MKNKILVFLSISLLLLAGGIAGLYYQATNTLPPNIGIILNNTSVPYTGATWSVPVFPNWMPDFFTDLWQIKSNMATDMMLSVVPLQGSVHSVQADYPCHFILNNEDGTTVYQGSSLQEYTFIKGGKYTLQTIQTLPESTKYKGKGQLHYTVQLQVADTPQFSLQTTNPVQGQLIKLEITGLLPGYEIKSQGAFKPSDIVYNPDGTAAIYIPITYYKPAGEYPISISLLKDGQSFDWQQTIFVQQASFSETHFTVEEETAQSTVNSAAANKEYREIIHPLYYTKDSNKYWDGAFIKPVEEKRISSEFGQIRYVNENPTPERHSGIDYAAPLGTPVFATAAGKVEYAGFLQLSGNTVVIEHGLGLKSYYFHMDSVNVSTGQQVQQGTQIGAVGTTGYSTGPHLHFQVSIENQPINPELLYQLQPAW